MGRLTLFNNEIRYAHRAQAGSRVIGNYDLMTRYCLAQLNRSGNARHDSIAHSTMMGATDVQAHCHFPERARMNNSGPRTERFTKGHRSTAMQKSKRLSVAMNWHRRDDALGGLFENRDAEFTVESPELNRPCRFRHDDILQTAQAKGSEL